MILPECGVCVEKSSKYKCPKCYIPFCSVSCSQAHRESPNCNPRHQVKREHVDNSLEDGEWITENTVPAESLAKLSECSRLKELLQNRNLRETLKALDQSSDPEAVLTEAMKDSDFQEFVNVCLAEVEPNGS